MTALAQRDNTIVFAGARNPEAASALQELAKKHPGKVHLLRLIAADEAGNHAAVAEIKEKVGRLDVVIANAGMSGTWSSRTAVAEQNPSGSHPAKHGTGTGDVSAANTRPL